MADSHVADGAKPKLKKGLSVVLPSELITTRPAQIVRQMSERAVAKMRKVSLYRMLSKRMGGLVSTGVHVDWNAEARARWLVLPDSKLRLKWDTALFMLVLVVALTEPLEIAFEEELKQMAGLQFIQSLALGVFSLDILANFNTALNMHGEYILGRDKIARQYLKGFFWIDVLSVLPLYTWFDNGGKQSRLLNVLHVLRLTKVPRILSRFEGSLDVNKQYLALGNMAFWLIIMWHWMSCGYWYVQSLSPIRASTDSTRWWAPAIEIRTQGNLGLQYAAAMSWGLTAITGSGRDIRPTTTLELSYSIATILVGVFIYAFIIGGISSTLTSSDSGDASKSRQLTQVREFLARRQVPRKLRRDIISWFEDTSSHSNFWSGQDKLLGVLHPALKLELNYLRYADLLGEIYVFKFVHNFECRLALLEKFKTLRMIPDETVIQEGDEGDSMFVVVSGTLNTWARINNTEEQLVNTFSRGDVFGQVALLNQVKRTATVVASSNCELLCLFREDFEEVRGRFPEFSRALSRVSTLSSGGWLRLRGVLQLAATTRLLSGRALSTKELLGITREVAVNKGGVVSVEHRELLFRVAATTESQKREKAILLRLLGQSKDKAKRVSVAE